MKANKNGTPKDETPEPAELGPAPATGKGVQWEADMAECQERNWWSRWNGFRWELATRGTPGAVEDLARLAALRQGQKVENDDAWRKVLDAKWSKEGAH